MAVWYGNVGFAETSETAPGVWQETCVDHPYSGDLISLRSNYQNVNQVLDDIQINTRIDIVADPFAYANFAHIRYVEIWGQKWKVTGADPSNYPRIALTIGGLYEDKE